MATITSVALVTGNLNFTATTSNPAGFDYGVFDSGNNLIDTDGSVPSGTTKVIGLGGTDTYTIQVIDGIQTDAIATFFYDADAQTLTVNSIIQGGAISMAGTAQGRLFKASVSLKEPNGKTFTLSGNGIDAAGAIGELQAKLAIIDSLVTVVSAVRISGNMSAGQITAFNTVNAARTTSGTGYDDADITLLQTFNAGTATQVRETPTLRVRDVRNDLADAGRDDGSVDLGAAEIVALATAYQDPDGNTGYVPYKGRFVLS